MIFQLMREAWPIVLHEHYKSWPRKRRALKLSLIVVGPLIIWLVGKVFSSFVDISMHGFGSYEDILSAGILSYILIGIAATNSSYVVREKKSFSRQLLVAPIRRFSILLGKMGGTLLSSMRIVFIYAIVLMALLNSFSLLKLVLLPLVITWITLTYLGLFTWVSTLFKKFDTAQTVTNTSVLAMVFLSGVFYPLGALPPMVRAITYVNPMTYSVELFRIALLGTYELDLLLILAASLVLGLLSILLGISAFTHNLRR